MSLHLLQLQFTLRSGGIRFPAFPGAAWHGGLGMMLERLHPQAFQALYSVTPESRLYAIKPAHAAAIPEGESFYLRVSLFGSATQYALAIGEAIAALGQVGLRPGGSYQIAAAHYLATTDWQAFFSEEGGLHNQPQAYPLADFLNVMPSGAHKLTLHFTTPLRIKEGNDLVRVAPRYEQLIKRTLGRLDQLAFSAGDSLLYSKESRASLLDEATAVCLASAHLESDSIERCSARSKQRMQFDGLLGEVEYAGEMSATLPIILAASLVQVGGKTAFGFGGIEIGNLLN